jgi:hypothetical protein
VVLEHQLIHYYRLALVVLEHQLIHYYRLALVVLEHQQLPVVLAVRQ